MSDPEPKMSDKEEAIDEDDDDGEEFNEEELMEIAKVMKLPLESEVSDDDDEVEVDDEPKETILEASETVDGAVETENLVSDHQTDKLLRLPISRVKKIIKLDPGVTIASQGAVFLIAKATELLLDSLSKEAYSYTVSENKKTVTRKHLDSAIYHIDALAFLDGCLD